MTLTASTVVSADTIRRLMRRHRVTSAQIAAHYDLPLTRVRHVRLHGGAWDWPLMIMTVAKDGAVGGTTKRSAPSA